jgi:hypothetical protein
MDDKLTLEPLPYVLVAEISTLPLIGIVVAGLRKHANPASVTVVVPNHQKATFEHVLESEATVIGEDKLLPDWPLERVRQRLANPDRAGWYLQQFLKLSFGKYSGTKEYVVWDADTVPLAAPLVGDRNRILFGKAAEYHKPYFETYRKILKLDPILPNSAISQYMRIDTTVVANMQEQISKTTGKACWIDGVLTSLSGDSISEFSEYETYANYFMSSHPTKGSMIKTPWFRYGSAICSDPHGLSLKFLEKKFSNYKYVAFERHKLRSARKAIAISNYAIDKLYARVLKALRRIVALGVSTS